MNDKVYITGISGLLGSNLAKMFLRKGYTVTGCDTLIGGYQDNIPEKYCKWYKIDILNLDALSETMGGCDIVVHTAALPHEGLSVFSPKLITESIYTGTVSVATAAIKNKVKKILNCSSMARYGEVFLPFTENTLCSPSDPYGLAKLHAEQALNLLSDIHGIKVFHVVPHNIIGEGQRYNDPFRNVAAIMINRLLQHKTLILYGDGEQKRSFSYVGDCVEPIIRILESDRFSTKEIFNIGPDGNEISIKQLGYLIGHICKVYPHFDHYPERPREVKNAWCSSEKAKKELNYAATTSINDTIKHMVSWIRKRGTLPFEYHLPLEIINEHTPETWKKELI